MTDPKAKEVFVHENFTQQLEKNDAGFYKTRLPWKPHHMALPDNKQLALARLHSTTRKPEKMVGSLIEHVPERLSGNIVHCVPHQPTIREQSQPRCV